MKEKNFNSIDKPTIPDHEILSMIGEGAFGKVWLARSVTGAYRAVKVVRRADYQNGSQYEREFHGILKFEPISRNHPGLMSILQVGRHDAEKDEERYYYYVMELADDVEMGRDIDPEKYVPDTFAERIHRSNRAEPEFCIEQGVILAEGLGFLHSGGLIHRDIKPPNIVFLNGRACLADIGLVAATGDKTFVGTEGFLAPEGPGTKSADIYALGMVLYELSTGKDRLDFPDVPTVIEEGPDSGLWRRVNRVVCRACAKSPERRYESGEEMALALKGEALRKNSLNKKWTGLVALGALLIGGYFLLGNKFSLEKNTPNGITNNPSDEPRTLVIKTEPAGAELYEGERYLGLTPQSIFPSPENPTSYTFRLKGYRHEQVEYRGDADDRSQISLDLERYVFPQEGVEWSNSLGRSFLPDGERGHVSFFPIRAIDFFEYARDTKMPAILSAINGKLEDGSEFSMAAISSREARSFSNWLFERDQKEGILTAEHSYKPVSIDINNLDFAFEEEIVLEDGQDFYLLRLSTQQYGDAIFRSEPPGAEVFHRGENIGVTPFTMPRMKSEEAEFEFRKAGYKTEYLKTSINSMMYNQFEVVLQKGQSADFTKKYTNSIAMEFVPMGNILVGVHEVSEEIFHQFISASLPETLDKQFSKLRSNSKFPVNFVSYDEAKMFCEWLTEIEKMLGQIASDHEYRLLTDKEWSWIAGLPKEKGNNPAQKNGKIVGHYPWGFRWPPKADSINTGPVPGYSDPWSGLAPVQAVEVNSKGLHHFSGNVWEWTSDEYGGRNTATAATMTTRGGGFMDGQKNRFYSSTRRPVSPVTRSIDVGFRCVLAKKSR